MKWSSKHIEKLLNDIEQGGSQNIRDIIRNFRIEAILNDSITVGDVPFETEGDFITFPLIKKFNVDFDYTKDEIQSILEIKKDASRFTDQMLILDQNGFSKYQLYQYQQELVSNYKSKRFNCIKHSRQVGVTFTLTLIMFHYAMFNEGESVYWISNNFQHDRVRLLSFYHSLPFYLKPAIKIDTHSKNKIEILFENGTTITFCKDIPRTNSIDFIVIDGAGYRHINHVINQLVPLMSSRMDSYCFVCSNPVRGSEFDQIFDSHSSIWNKIKINWDVVPGRDSNWVLETSHQIGGYHKFLEEYELDTIVSPIIREALIKEIVK